MWILIEVRIVVLVWHMSPVPPQEGCCEAWTTERTNTEWVISTMLCLFKHFKESLKSEGLVSLGLIYNKVVKNNLNWLNMNTLAQMVNSTIYWSEVLPIIEANKILMCYRIHFTNILMCIINVQYLYSHKKTPVQSPINRLIDSAI